MATLQLQDKVALVTGAGTGIGKGIAVALAQRGASVIVHYNASQSGAQDTLDQIVALGAKAVIYQADVAIKQQVTDMVDFAVSHFGKIDILVNNAAAQTNMSLMEYDDESYDQVMNVNLKGYFLCTQAVVPSMKQQGGGRIINVSSVHGKRPTDFDVVYAMTKGGIKMLTRESAVELAKYHITVNTIEPGAVYIGTKSGNPKSIMPTERVTDEHRRRSMRKFPLGRSGLPSDIGYLTCFLASKESEWMTGAAIRADGGSMLL